MGNWPAAGATARPSAAVKISPDAAPGPDRTRQADKDHRKVLRKQRKLVASALLPLDGWQRIHILVDLVDEQRNLVEVCDHKARFALVIVGAVNAVLLLVGMRAMPSVPAALEPWLLGLLVPYVAVTLVLVAYVIEVLKPRTRDYLDELAEGGRQWFRPGEPGFEDQPCGLFFFTEILRSDLARYRQLWKGALLGQVGAELAVLAHGLAHVNRNQYAALDHVFRGLRLMIALAAILVLLLVAVTFYGQRL